MLTKKIKLSVILLVGINLTSIQAQEAIPSSGGNAAGNNGSVSYTVGQVTYGTNTATNGSLAEGVQQPYEIMGGTGIEENKNITLMCSAYPNPTNGFLILKIENTSYEELSYQLFDITGKLMDNNEISGEETLIHVENFLPATYFLKVTNNNKAIRTFEIIKNSDQ